MALIGFYNFNVWPDMMIDLVLPTNTPGYTEKDTVQAMSALSGNGYYQVGKM